MELAGKRNRNHINSRSFMKCATLLHVLAVPPLPQEKRTTQSRWTNVTIEQGLFFNERNSIFREPVLPSASNGAEYLCFCTMPDPLWSQCCRAAGRDTFI